MGLITSRHEYLASRADQTFAAFGIERDKLVLGNPVKIAISQSADRAVRTIPHPARSNRNPVSFIE